MRNVTRLGRTPVLLLSVLAAAACTAPQHTTGTRPADPAPAPPASASASADPATREPAVVTPPSLYASLGESLAGRQEPTRGNAVFAYTGGARGRALVVAVSCLGEGKVTVDLPAMGVSFPHTCTSGEPAEVQNEFALSTEHRPGTVSVEAPSTVVWAATVSRVEPAGEDTTG
ncbi:hypothetical protein [Streptomyces sp. NPDC093094]|uniref:hypothetical protein n=1 Tax=Streptomyces sp. NPDC093094 TaxID=3366026 RepID=UPI00382BEDB8